jgi:hypothetical protein
MRVVPERSPWMQIVAVFGGFLLGPYMGLRLSVHLAPGSELVQTVSSFGFALVFVGGTLVWAGMGIVTVVAGALWNLLRGRRPGPEGLRSSDRTVPPGYRAYPAFGVALGLLVGIVAGAATDLSLLAAAAIWSTAGLAYGFLLSTAAHHGYLPFPEPE